MTTRLAAIVLGLTTLAGSTPAMADCSPVLADVLTAVAKPALDNADLCSIPGKIGLDHKTVELRNVSYCPGAADSTLGATIYVQCKTSDSAFIKASMSETVDLGATIDNTSCALTAFSLSPHGDIGQFIVNNSNISHTIRKAAEQQLQKLCGH